MSYIKRHLTILWMLTFIGVGVRPLFAQNFLPEYLRSLVQQADQVSEIAAEDWKGMIPHKGKVVLMTKESAFVLEAIPDVSALPLGLYDRKLDTWVLPIISSSYPGSNFVTWAIPGQAPQTIMPSDEEFVKQKAIWALTYTHEIFHQWQMSQSNYFYAFEQLSFTADQFDMWTDATTTFYQKKEIRDFIVNMADQLSSKNVDMRQVEEEWTNLETSVTMQELDFIRYQLWQEGLAKYVEYATIDHILDDQSAFDKNFKDQTRTYKISLEKRIAEMKKGNVDASSLYLLGIVLGESLDQNSNEWKDVYFTYPFQIQALVETLIKSPAID